MGGRGARQEEAEAGPLPGPIFHAGVALADLEDADVGASLALVEGQHVEQAGGEMLPENRMLGRKRVRHDDLAAGLGGQFG